jgi:hypothetical protein
VTSFDLDMNAIGSNGASAIADALKVNSSLINLLIQHNGIGDKGALAFVDALKVNTSVTKIDLEGNEISATGKLTVENLLERNRRFRRMLLFDARQLLLSVLCTDELGVLWPYVVDKDDTDGIVAPANVDAVRIELAAVVAERSRTALASDVRAMQRLFSMHTAEIRRTMQTQS